MTDYSPDLITHAGVTANVRSAASGDKLTNPGDHKILRVTNGGGSPITLTITVPGTTQYGVNNPVKTVSVTNATSKAILIRPDYGDPADAGKVSLSWSATTSVTFEYFGS